MAERERFSETEVIDRVERLTRTRLVSFVEAEIVRPVQTEAGPAYRRIDIARMELLCELADDFGLQTDALGMIISLIDQLHGVRGELRALCAALESEPQETRARLGAALIAARRGG